MMLVYAGVATLVWSSFGQQEFGQNQPWRKNNHLHRYDQPGDQNYAVVEHQAHQQPSSLHPSSRFLATASTTQPPQEAGSSFSDQFFAVAKLLAIVVAAIPVVATCVSCLRGHCCFEGFFFPGWTGPYLMIGPKKDHKVERGGKLAYLESGSKTWQEAEFREYSNGTITIRLKGCEDQKRISVTDFAKMVKNNVVMPGAYAGITIAERKPNQSGTAEESKPNQSGNTEQDKLMASDPPANPVNPGA
mmetsp:Transcript_64938/g.152777  ORF Transcript_64938/g.152777 Transcript_64938/m.152777 type:complete len:246 (-) Transcript_64938:83-820(-)